MGVVVGRQKHLFCFLSLPSAARPSFLFPSSSSFSVMTPPSLLLPSLSVRSRGETEKERAIEGNDEQRRRPSGEGEGGARADVGQGGGGAPLPPRRRRRLAVASRSQERVRRSGAASHCAGAAYNKKKKKRKDSLPAAALLVASSFGGGSCDRRGERERKKNKCRQRGDLLRVQKSRPPLTKPVSSSPSELHVPVCQVSFGPGS